LGTNLQSSKTQYGLSYIEMVIVVIILGIVAAAAMPDLSSTNGTKLDNASNEITSAISFAQSEAIRTKISYGVSIDVANDRIRVYRLPSSTAVYDVYHPIDKKLYDLQLKTDAYSQGVDLISTSFVFGGSYSSATNLDFSTDGIPKYTSGGTDYMLTTGSLTLSYQSQQRVIKIAPMTGRVTIE
jgi:prepilin-type N-terminal cleavage/methylation domain-containing protein